MPAESLASGADSVLTLWKHGIRLRGTGEKRGTVSSQSAVAGVLTLTQLKPNGGLKHIYCLTETRPVSGGDGGVPTPHTLVAPFHPPLPVQPSAGVVPAPSLPSQPHSHLDSEVPCPSCPSLCRWEEREPQLSPRLSVSTARRWLGSALPRLPVGREGKPPREKLSCCLLHSRHLALLSRRALDRHCFPWLFPRGEKINEPRV